MLVAPRKAAGPEWLKIMGAEILFAPIDRGMFRRARRAALEKLGRSEVPATDESAAEQLEDLGDALSESLILEGARDWRDVGQQRFKDTGEPLLDDIGNPQFEPLPFSLENLRAVLSDPIVFQAFDAAYVVPFAARERAKNGFAASPVGTGVAGTPGKDTANFRARPGKARGAKPAHTRSKVSKATKLK
ncbi:hypothetical protein HNP52_000347 [Sphingomonas kyeonggiensis]|uniref:Uncharacterized protein n=1 Tax=Sphingomonas kyeonggiensis TaxID=1268553 RepID=A0A7W7JXQ3_9SPHN|nr:hypothetical protein [Sphingomonas kyeonggiensis]MBB4837296.1 hypothetical protein [Sphingomonas kyeonggiensis]